MTFDSLFKHEKPAASGKGPDCRGKTPAECDRLKRELATEQQKQKEHKKAAAQRAPGPPKPAPPAVHPATVKTPPGHDIGRMLVFDHAKDNAKAGVLGEKKEERK